MNGQVRSESGLSMVVPVYRGEATLTRLYDEIVGAIEPLGREFEIIFVEDCGGDGSWRVIETIAARDARVRGIRLYRNFGQHNALLCGIRHAQFPITVTLDDDLQNPPSEIPKMLEAFRGDVDVIYGTPAKEQHGFFRDFASRLTKMALKSIMGAEAARNVSAFRIFRTDLRMAFADFCSPNVSIDVLLSWGTTQFKPIAVEHHPRETGRSGYSFGKLTGHAFNLMTGYSAVPLHFASMLGFLFMLFGFGVLAWVLGRYFLGDGSPVQGFPFLASTIAIFSGVQLFSLGIFGEYLARIHFRTMNQPPFLVAGETGGTPESSLLQREKRGLNTSCELSESET